MAKAITLLDFLTGKEINQVSEIFKKHKAATESLNVEAAEGHSVADKICKEVIEPNLERINKSLGQNNDPMYLAYACEYVMLQTGQ